MGLLDLLKGGGMKRRRCASCKAEGGDLPFSKKFDGITYLFCSKECDRRFRIDRKKPAKGPATGRSMPW
jgi:YHS domain-containing protein